MRTYQDIVDALETILSSDQDPTEAEMAAVENDYVQAIQAVNARLKKADELLRKGHRAEALGLCDADPNLLDAVQVLDFPDREIWAEFVQDFGLPAPPLLKIDVASDLNDAYPQEQQLAPLLRRHRFLALARSDLRSRIDVMRRIAKIDTTNPIWNEDLKEFERSRHTEIQREFKDAVSRCDSTAVAAIERELVDPRWLIAPPRTVIRQAQAEHARLRSVHARRDLEKLEPELTAAFADFDLGRGRQLRERWDQKASIANLPDGDPLLELVAPALEWLEAEDQRERADAEYAATVKALVAGLDTKADRLELERLYHGVARLERGLDPGLEQRLTERLKYLDLERARKIRIRVTAIVAVVVLAGAVTAFAVFRHLRSNTIATHVANLQTLIENMQLGEAREYLGKLESDLPYVVESADVQGLIGTLQAAEKSDGGRRALRAEHLASAQAIVEGASLQSIEAASAKPDVSLAALGRAQGHLDEALERSSSEGERAEVDRWERRVSDLRQGIQGRIDEEFQQELGGLSRRVAQTNPDDLAAFRRLRDEAMTLADRQHVTPALLAGIEPLVKQIRANEDAAYERQRQRQALSELTRAVGLASREAYVRELEEFAQQFPQTERARTFGRLARDEADLWKGAQEWRALSDRWSRQNFAAVSASDAGAFVRDASTLLEAHGKFPGASRLAELVEHLQAVGQRVDSDGQKLEQRLVDPLNNPTVFDIYVLRTKDGRSYYSKQLPVKLGDRWQIKYILDTTLQNWKAEFFEPVEIVNAVRSGKIVWDAPQFEFARYAQEATARMGAHEWESTFVDVVERLVDDKEIDSVLKLQLLSIVLQTACDGSGVLKQAFARHIEQLQTARVGGAVNWLDPGDKGGQNARIQASGALSRMPRMQDVRREVEAGLARLKDPDFGPRYNWLGWLKQEPSDVWTCEYPQNLKPGSRSTTELYVLLRPSADGDVRYERIGEFRNGALKMAAPAPAAFVEGRPVYALQN